MPSCIKGTGIKIFLDWLSEILPVEEQAKLFAKLKGEAKELASGTIFASSNYSYNLYGEILESCADYFGDDYAARAESHGAYAADRLMTTIYRCALKAGDVAETLRALAVGWRFYFDTGAINLREVDQGHFVYEINDSHYHPLHPPISAGYLKRGCEMAGAKDVRIQIEGVPPVVKIAIFWKAERGGAE